MEKSKYSGRFSVAVFNCDREPFRVSETLKVWNQPAHHCPGFFPAGVVRGGFSKNKIAYGKNQTEFEKESLALMMPTLPSILPSGEIKRGDFPQRDLSFEKDPEGVNLSQVQTNRRLLVLPPWGELEGVSNLTILIRQLTDIRSTMNYILKLKLTKGDLYNNKAKKGNPEEKNTPLLSWPGRPGSGVQTFINRSFSFRSPYGGNPGGKGVKNFNKMKKQFLILILFVAAIVAGTSNAFGQSTVSLDQANTANIPIDPLNCISSSLPLHPFAGVPYTYAMEGDNGEEHANAWTWWATQDLEFITDYATLNLVDSLKKSTGDILYWDPHYGTPTADADSIVITWSPKLLANTKWHAEAADAPKKSTFVVGYATGENCADNIQVYEINPQPNFTLDIANIHPEADTTMAWDSVAEQCVSPVLSATYDVGTHYLDMDYGYDTLYFEIAAANFVNDFTLYFNLVAGSLNGNQEAYLDLYTSKTLAQSGEVSGGTNSVASTTWATGATEWVPDVRFEANDPLEVVDGVSVFLRVIIWNQDYESLTTNPFEIIVDARDDDNTGIWDMEDADCTTLTDAQDQVDRATHNILPRPQLDMNKGAMGEDNGVDPDNRVPKTNATDPATTYPEW